jgi:NAD(P)-dependent dehydrogenase (short-subunit alcohol dehydrogenase family)
MPGVCPVVGVHAERGAVASTDHDHGTRQRGAIVPWTATDMPDLAGTTAIVTGPTSGVGEASAIALAARHAHVVLAARDHAKAAALIERIRARRPDASLEHLSLDLADLRSVQAAADTFLDRHPAVDLVVANAGIMATPPRVTADGFELQVGVNHLGHFALVGRLLPALLAAKAGRVVTVASSMHRIGQVDPDTVERIPDPYDRWLVYGRSKLANLLFLLGLQRRLEQAGAPLISVGAHPGYARTNLQLAGPTMQGGVSGRITRAVLGVGNALFGQPASQGALPTLYAATAPDVSGGSYWGPNWPGGQRGYPAPASRSKLAKDVTLADALWERSEELSGVRYDLPILASR